MLTKERWVMRVDDGELHNFLDPASPTYCTEALLASTYGLQQQPWYSLLGSAVGFHIYRRSLLSEYDGIVLYFIHRPIDTRWKFLIPATLIRHHPIQRALHGKTMNHFIYWISYAIMKFTSLWFDLRDPILNNHFEAQPVLCFSSSAQSKLYGNSTRIHFFFRLRMLTTVCCIVVFQIRRNQRFSFSHPLWSSKEKSKRGTLV